MYRSNVFSHAVLLRFPHFAFACLTIGTLDLVACSLFWARHGIPMWQVAQGPASWLLGGRAYSLGAPSILLGLGVLYSVAALSVLAYWKLSERYPVMHRAPLAWGAVYGTAIFVTLVGAIVPLSAAPKSPSVDYGWLAALLGIHVFLIGIPCALFARARRHALRAHF